MTQARHEAAFAPPLAGKRVLIIGGGGEGNGRAITRAAAAAGAAGVAVVDKDADRATEAADEIGGLGLAADVRVTADIDRAVAESVAGLGGLDTLITVVGGMGIFAPWDALDATTDETWDLLLELNLTYVFRTVRAVVKVFLEQEAGGTIVSVGSLAGTTGSPMSVAYGAAKAALVNVAATVAAEYGRRGIRMNVLNCGIILTPGAAASIGSAVSAMVEPVPMGRAGTPQDVADAVVFLASPQSSYISGQSLNLDGGVSARFPLRLPNTDPSMAG